MADEKPGGSGLAEADSEQKEGSISLNEYIEAERDLEDDARAVLGGSDVSNCTYSQGYMQRQALYSCATCTGGDNAPAGVCLACSLECHDGHDLYELYTKRSFRCDCGNSKFEGECKLQKEKESSNPLNKYGHNFEGVYCSCNRPYPDPDNENDGEMIQCCICEDWHHDVHLELKNEVPSDYEEMICMHCVRLHPFLLNYQSNQASNTVKIVHEEEDKEVDITSSTDGDSESVSASTTTQQPTSQTSDASSTLVSASISDNSSPNKPVPCKNLTPQPAADCQTLFMAAGWRQTLCTCSHCKQHYKAESIEYLLDAEDPTMVYEQKAQNEGDSASNYEKGMDALSNLGRVQQIELLSGYNDMKSSLADYFKHFVSSNKVVKADDIKEFFEEYSKSKRRRLAVPPPSCS